MAQNTLIQVRVEDTLKNDTDALFSDLGLDTSTAIRIFLKQAVKQHGLPFHVGQPVPNTETIAAMEEADRISCDPATKRCSSPSELLAEVQDEI